MEVCTVGGYGEIGKNMTAIKIGEEVVIIDMGIYLPALLNLENEEQQRGLSITELYNLGVVPDDGVIKDWKSKVKAIVLGHCHLDHIGAVQYIAKKYNCPIYGSPYTIQVLRALLKDDRRRKNNLDLRPISQDKKVKVSKNFELELITVTHSTVQASITTLHTPEGAIMYTLDYKLDNHPTLGKKTNYPRLREVAKQGVKLLIDEALYADVDMKTPSEKVAKEMMKDVLLSVESKNRAIFVTTFASHLARISTIMDAAAKLKRKVLILGRSMYKYINAAEDLKLVDFSSRAEFGSYRAKSAKLLEKVSKDPGKYLVICTGNQAEPGSVLVRMINKEFHYKFNEKDIVIFSCRTIPQPLNIANREMLESKLRRNKVRIFKDIHVSGHASREDHRDFIHMIKPKFIIPAHGDHQKEAALAQLAAEEGYIVGKNVFLMADGQKMEL
jgi:ribonuclease J